LMPRCPSAISSRSWATSLAGMFRSAASRCTASWTHVATRKPRCLGRVFSVPLRGRAMLRDFR
jgi:hypothetical protein